jgi:ADP-heptose:LPS heptosyltransferase
MQFREDCLYFNGYKPCKRGLVCKNCTEFRPEGQRIAVISLEAMGAVLRSTVLLKPILRNHPDSKITWITLPSSAPLLENNPYIHEILTYSYRTLPILQAREFDLLFAVDKSSEAGALAELIRAKEKRGFGLSSTGKIRPLSHHAGYAYQVGLNDELKFYLNQKPETQMTTEAMGLKWQRDPYVLEFTESEKKLVEERVSTVRKLATGPIIGFNTGCSELFPYKKLRNELPNSPILLLGGGRQDTLRQIHMKEAFAQDPMVINTPSEDGLREGIIWLDIADLVISGCTLGLHMAIARAKLIVAWFTVSCSQEIDLYDKGRKVKTVVGCAPCWRKGCNKEEKCYDHVSLDEIVDSCKRLINSSH